MAQKTGEKNKLGYQLSLIFHPWVKQTYGWILLIGIVAGLVMPFFRERKAGMPSDSKAIKEVRLIPFGSVTKNIRFLPNEGVIKVQTPPAGQKSNWIEAPAGKKIVAETPSNSDGFPDPKSWACMELPNGMQRCSNDPDPPKDFHQNTYAIRVWGQGGDGYIPVSVY